MSDLYSGVQPIGNEDLEESVQAEVDKQTEELGRLRPSYEVASKMIADERKAIWDLRTFSGGNTSPEEMIIEIEARKRYDALLGHLSSRFKDTLTNAERKAGR